MQRLSLRLDLLDEVAISRRAASTGGQPGLDYLPGANLLGAVAAALYEDLAREDAWTLFHSGKARFGNGLPVGPGDEPFWPMPLCWSQDAEAPALEEDGKLSPERVRNLMHCRDGEPPPSPDGRARPALPMPEGYVSLSGRCLRPKMAFRMKTAISPETGRLAGQRLFGYESLAEGQRFAADIAFDEDIPERLAERLRGFFEARPVLRFGRSRSAQYGRVECQLVSASPMLPEPLPEIGSEFSLWLLSDLAACDRHGFPTLAPESEDLGLPLAEAVPGKTFVSCRAYSPYNGFHRLHGSERQVIGQGSVLTYRLLSPLEPAARSTLDARIERGLGLYRECGLGRCALAPALLATRHPQFGPAPADAEPVATELAAPDHPLARWLLETAESRSIQGSMRHWAGRAVTELDLLEQNARRLSGLREDQTASPSRSHWGRVAEAARRATASASGQKRLREELFSDANSICRMHDQDWGRPTANAEGQSLTYRSWLERKVAERPHDAPSAIGLLAELAQRRLTSKH
jgi:hypothetical protein